jgi:outer membrane protein assembly factor BamB
MTVPELLQLFSEKAPGELSALELAEIHRSLPQSPELRRALGDQLLLEEILGHSLGRLQVPVDELWRRHRARPAIRRSLGMTLLLLVAGWFVCGGLTWFLLDSAELLGPHADIVANDPPRPPKPTVSPPTAPPGTDAAAPEEQNLFSAATNTEKPADAAVPQTPEVAAQPAPNAPAADDPDSAAAAAPVDSNPWPELAGDRPRVPFVERVFQDSAKPAVGLTQNQLTRWLGEVLGETKRFTSETRGETPISGFEGLTRLLPPWPPDAVLQMTPFDHDGMAVHFWNGMNGISFYFYEHPQPVWAAYQTTRLADEPRPRTHVLVGTDNARYERSLAGMVEIRHQDGTVVLSRGDLRLLTAPLAAPPAEVYFDRRAAFRSFTMYRGEPIPDEPELATRPLLADPSPARQEWTGPLPDGAALKREPTGITRLTRAQGAGIAWTGFKLPRTGLYEVVVQLDEATPGTGLFLGDRNGQPVHVVGLRRERKTGAPAWAFLDLRTRNFETGGNAAVERVPFAGPGQWLRIIVGCGTLKFQVSGDGRNWGRALDPLRGTRGELFQLGLIAFATDAPGRIGLRTVQLREFSELTALARADLIKRVPESLLDARRGFTPWCGDVLKAQPAGIDAAAWRSACAVRILSEGNPGEFGNEVLAGLLDDSLDREISPEAHLRVLDQAALVMDTWEPPQLEQLLLCYDRLGRSLAEHGNLRPYSAPGRSLMAGPIWTPIPYQVVPEHLVRAEVVRLLYQSQWSDVLALCDRLRFWNHPARPDKTWPDHRLRVRRLVEWAALRAREAVGEPGLDDDAAPATLRWRPPVAAQLSKDGLNVIADLQAALADEQYVEAGKILVATRPEQSTGLLPDPEDPDLYQALPQVVAAAMQAHPEWRRTMIERNGTLGRLRVQQAITRGIAEELQSVAVQFSGTPAAATACRWLGDRALAEGNFVAALAEFQRARHAADPEQTNELLGRERLAGALAGRLVGAPVQGATPFLDRTLSGPDLESLVAEMLPRNTAKSAEPARAAESSAGFEPVVWQAELREEWKGQTGGPPEVDIRNVDWGARQLACQVAGDLLYVSNRLQIACYNLETVRRLWVQVFPNAGYGSTNWPLLAFRPVVTADRIFIRRLQKNGPGLCCLDAISSKERWSTDPNLVACSDPLLIQGRLYCFTTASLPQDRSWNLELTALDPRTGDVALQTQVLELQGAGDQVPACQVTFSDTQLVGAIGGAVFSCDLTGRPLWLRQQTWIPAAADTRTGEQDYGLPAVVGNRVIVIQPGVLDLACLDAETGRRVWHLPIADARRLLGCDNRQAYLETAEGLLAVSIADGTIVWQHPVDQLLDAYWLGSDGTLLYTRREAHGLDRSCPLLVWLNTGTGRETAVWPLTELTDQLPLLGPLVKRGSRFWTFFGRGPNGGPRSLCELIPAHEPAFLPHSDPQTVDRWTAPDEDPDVRLMSARFLPEWSQLGGLPGPGVGFRAEFREQHEVLVTLAEPEHPLLFTRELTIDPGRKPRLVVLAGHDPAEEWTLRVHAGGRLVLTAPVGSRTVRKSWGRWEVDLSEFAGNSIRVVVEQHCTGKPAHAFWKQVEIVP